MRSSGAGGSSANRSETAVRVTHLPTGLVVKCEQLASQIDNTKIALKWLAAKLRARQEAEERKERSKIYAASLDPANATERRVRTYCSWQPSLVKDHRHGLVDASGGGMLTAESFDDFLEWGVIWTKLQELEEKG
eukprot:TRINITY_DN37932_c0_g1_i1.p2 TRINITY_DN37932_c0_g1~~TRINITY_DN37932_c0_g1_i1.p2  ORF type:complete len:135 (+),score=17.56 TRINITY_DN37932_c0_g1_i1:381-785(+)